MIYGYQIDAILDKHVKEIPYEGKEVNRQGIIEDVLQLIENDQQRERKNTGGSGKPISES